MHWFGVMGGVLLVLIGGVWLLQGLGSEFVPQSFMTGSGVWVVIGAATMLVGLVVARLAWIRR